LSITDAAQTGLDFTTKLSIEYWSKLTSLSSGDSITKTGGTGNQYRVQHKSTGKIEFYVSSSGTDSNAERWDSDNVISTTGVWCHIAITYDVATQAAIMYVDGSSVPISKNFDNNMGSPIFNGTGQFRIGEREGGSFYDGLIDEVICWNDIRTPTEISESYNGGDGKIYVGDESGMVGYWRMEDDVLDLTSNNNDLTNNNGATFSADVPFSGAAPAGFAHSQAVIIT